MVAEINNHIFIPSIVPEELHNFELYLLSFANAGMPDDSFTKFYSKNSSACFFWDRAFLFS